VPIVSGLVFKFKPLFTIGDFHWPPHRHIVPGSQAAYHGDVDLIRIGLRLSPIVVQPGGTQRQVALFEFRSASVC